MRPCGSAGREESVRSGEIDKASAWIDRQQNHVNLRAYTQAATSSHETSLDFAVQDFQPRRLSCCSGYHGVKCLANVISQRERRGPLARATFVLGGINALRELEVNETVDAVGVDEFDRDFHADG